NHNAALSSHLDIHPGEDDLFVKSVYHHNNVAVECSSEALLLNQQSPLGYAWRKDRHSRAFTSRFYFAGPKMVKHLDSLTRFLTVLPAWFLIGYSVFAHQWILLAAIVLLLALHWFLLVLTPYQLSKQLGIHRYILSPLLSELYTPCVDLWYRLRVAFNPDQFYVARIGK
ncbi:MAG: hypothetical protein Q4B58_04370, partial [Bacteroidales bacterium]|nr:hypothetical protein [Bacteroidales bacterium]